jgi:hypothetical protein
VCEFFSSVQHILSGKQASYLCNNFDTFSYRHTFAYRDEMNSAPDDDKSAIDPYFSVLSCPILS